jgi:hypothetical protein
MRVKLEHLHFVAKNNHRGKFVAFKRSFPVLLAAILQAMPMTRCALALQTLVLGPSWACVLRLTGTTAALLGACDAVSGASAIVPPYTVKAELGHAYTRVLGTSVDIAHSWSASSGNLRSATFTLAPGLYLTNATGFIGGVPTQAGTFTTTITAWEDVGNTGLSTSDLFTFTITNGGTPGLFTQPVGNTNNVGAAVSLEVSAYGALPLSYQWQYNGAAIPGATTNTYGIANLQQSQSGTYNVLVSNVLGSIASSNATLVVNSPFILQSVLQDQTITLSFPAVPGTVYTIQASADLINWTPISNVTASTSAVLVSNSATNSSLFYRAWHP